MNRQKLAQDLLRDEGFVPHAYQDHLGFWTIGIGRLCDKRKPGSGLTQDEAMYLLNNDIDRVYGSLKARAPWIISLTDNRKHALINMAFQLGVSGLMNFKKAMEALRNSQYEDAAMHFMDSQWAKQTPERAHRVTQLILKG